MTVTLLRSVVDPEEVARHLREHSHGHNLRIAKIGRTIALRWTTKPVHLTREDAMTTEHQGVDGRTCGLHRPVGVRAWCPDCSEWCAPGALCAGCEEALMTSETRDEISEIVRRLAARDGNEDPQMSEAMRRFLDIYGHGYNGAERINICLGFWGGYRAGRETL